jgi:putative phosphoesterase
VKSVKSVAKIETDTLPNLSSFHPSNQNPYLYLHKMAKILILSDTHGHLDARIAKYALEADEIWHAGDIGTLKICEELKKIKPLKAVFGNIDGTEIRKEYPENLVFMCEGVKVFITHIGGYPGKYSLTAKKIIEQEKPKLFICGHSHILKVLFDKKNELLHINPGAAGVHGFHLKKTMIRLEIEKGEMKNLEVIELGPRSNLTL